MSEENEKNIIPMISFSEDENSEFIPILSDEEESEFIKEDVPTIIPILPLRNNVLFPGVVIPITVGRKSSKKLINDALKGDGLIGVFTQKDPSIEAPSRDDINTIGVMAQILKKIKIVFISRFS